jgi:hypothetical protein
VPIGDISILEDSCEKKDVFKNDRTTNKHDVMQPFINKIKVKLIKGIRV